MSDKILNALFSQRKLSIFALNIIIIKVKISASIYSSQNEDLNSLIRELDAYQSDFFHIDCNEDPSVFDDIRKIKAHSNTPIDLHLITENPQKYFAQIKELEIASLTLQYEALTKDFVLPEDLGCEFGIAITTDTDISVFEKYAGFANHILFMATTPGVSGEAFKQKNFRKIRDFRTCFPEKHIHVDGGINAELSFILRNMGVYLAVVGSYLLKQEFIGSAMMKLRSDSVASAYKVYDFMLEYDEIPVLKASEFQMYEMLKTVEKYKIGFVNIVDENKKLLGIISNADIRKALIKKWKDINSISLNDIINNKPAIIREDNNIDDLLNYIKSLSFPILFLPVVNKSGILCGTIKFNNLIRGEL